MKASTLKRYYQLLPWLGWLTLAIAGMNQFLVQTSISVMVPQLSHTFSISSLGVSILSSSFFFTYIACQIPAGILIDYVRPRRTLLVTQIVIAILAVVFAKATSVWTLGASRFLMGIFCAPAIVSALYKAARALPPRYFALVAGLTEMMGMLGGMMGESLLARSVNAYGWRTTTLFITASCLVITVLVYFFVIDHEPDEESTTSPTTSDTFWQDFFGMLAMPQAWINGLFCGLVFSIIGAFGSFWAIPFFMKAYGVPLEQAADASAMIFIGAAVGTPLIGWLSERIGVRRYWMASCTLVTAIIMLGIIFIHFPYKWMFVWCFLLGLFSSAYLLAFAVMRDMTLPSMRGTAMGYINMMSILIGAPILQPLIGWILHLHSRVTLLHFQEALLVIPVSLILAMILAILVKPREEIYEEVKLEEEILAEAEEVSKSVS